MCYEARRGIRYSKGALHISYQLENRRCFLFSCDGMRSNRQRGGIDRLIPLQQSQLPHVSNGKSSALGSLRFLFAFVLVSFALLSVPPLHRAPVKPRPIRDAELSKRSVVTRNQPSAVYRQVRHVLVG